MVEWFGFIDSKLPKLRLTWNQENVFVVGMDTSYILVWGWLIDYDRVMGNESG